MLERLPKSRVSGMCMNRSIVTIEPALAGWVVSFEGQALQVLPSKLEAIGFASRRAAEQHRNSGAPCGVSVGLRTGAYPDPGQLGSKVVGIQVGRGTGRGRTGQCMEEPGVTRY